MENKKIKRQIKSIDKLKLDFSQVVFLQSDINYTEVHFSNMRKEVFAYTLKLFEDFLSINGHFIRIHRHFMVNKQFIELKNSQKIKLMTGIYLPIARRRKNEV